LSNEKKEKNAVALNGRCLKYFHATTNQKHAATIDNGTKERCKWQGVGRKHNSIVFGAIKLGGDKKYNKINEFTK
jgi:hypothetical protein